MVTGLWFIVCSCFGYETLIYGKALLVRAFCFGGKPKDLERLGLLIDIGMEGRSMPVGCGFLSGVLVA